MQLALPPELGAQVKLAAASGFIVAGPSGSSISSQGSSLAHLAYLAY